MSFFIGISFAILLALFTVVFYLIARRLPKEFLLAGVVLMFVGDGVLVAIWYYGLIEMIEDIKVFKLGIAASFAIAAFSRSIYFMLNYDE